MNADPDVTVLLAALEPSLPETRLETALALLGRHRQALPEAVAAGLVRVVDDQVHVVDPAVAHRIVRRVSASASAGRHTWLWRARSSARCPGTTPGPCSSASATPWTGPGRSVPLTRQEEHVAELAATGATTREIAAAAFLSPKTVEYHLSRIYRKLGVRSKAELAWAFHGGEASLRGAHAR